MIYEGERVDDLQCRGRRIIQHPGEFCFGMDAVLLAHFANVKSRDRVLDLCTGSGVIPLLLTAHHPGCRVTGLEIQAAQADRAARSVALNNAEGEIDIRCGDLRSAFLPRHAFDHVTVNPPYQRVESGRLCGDEPRRIARQEVCCDFRDVARCAARSLREMGRLSLVYRPERLAEAIGILEDEGFAAKRLLLVQPYAGAAPNLFLMECIYHGKPGLVCMPPLAIYDREGHYTKEALAYYGE